MTSVTGAPVPAAPAARPGLLSRPGPRRTARQAALAEGGPLGREPLYLAIWLVLLSVPPGLLAVRRWQSG